MFLKYFWNKKQTVVLWNHLLPDSDRDKGDGTLWSSLEPGILFPTLNLLAAKMFLDFEREAIIV